MLDPPPTAETASKARSARRRAAAMAALVVLVAAAVALISQLAGSGDGAPLNAVAAAAVKTREEAGGRATMRMATSLPDGRSLLITGQMAFDADSARGVLAVPAVGSKPASTMRMISDGAVLYMSWPVLDLPPGQKWMKIDLEAATGLKLPVPSTSDPRDELALLESAGEVQKLGKEDVRGVATSHYRCTIGVPEAAEVMRERGEDELAEKFEATGTTMHFDVWIGSDGLVRRLHVVDLQSKGSGTSTDMSIEFFDFGLEPRIEPPDSSEVFDATSLAKSS